jgi:ribosomal peptide maturation radical SAM protein 1
MENPIDSRRSKPRVALIYPPYAPDIVPSLGLGILSTGVKALGFDCTTFYWNLHFRRAIHSRGYRYGVVSAESAFPLNEWIFTPAVYDDPPATIESLLAESPGCADALLHGTWRRRKSYHTLGRAAELRELADESVAEMLEKLADFDIVGINTTFFQNMPALALAKRLKQRWPRKWVVLGGANCEDVMGPTLLENFEFLDAVFSGEVDFSFPEFVRKFSEGSKFEEISGICYRDNGRIVCGPRATPLATMDDLPIPDFDDYVIERERAGLDIEPMLIPLESSRGCWWGAKSHCTFCGLNALGMSYRQKSHERFQQEVEAIVDRYRSRYIFTTDNILSMEYFKEFMDWARDRRVKVHLFYETKSNMNRQRVERLVEAGITRIQPGIESLSTKTLTLMRKGVTGIQNVALLKFLSETGISSVYSILAGFPGEDPAEYERMAQASKRFVHLPPPRGVSVIRYHRFSPYHQDPESFGIRIRPSPKYPSLYPFGEDVISRLAYHFERVASPSFEYLSAMRSRLRVWSRAYFLREALLGSGSSLWWERSGQDIVVHDHRHGFPACRYRLKNHAVSVFRALDSPSTIPALSRKSGSRHATPAATREEGVRDWSESSARWWLRLLHGLNRACLRGWYAMRTPERVIDFGEEEFTRDPGACLSRFDDAGFVYVEDETYLALPVALDARRVTAQWPQEVTTTRLSLPKWMKAVGVLAFGRRPV